MVIVSRIDTSNRQSIVLTGSGFDPIIENNIVTLGDYQCKITSATTTRLVCTPGLFSNRMIYLYIGVAHYSYRTENIAVMLMF